MSEIGIGNCHSCLHFEDNSMGEYCYKEKMIYLGNELREGYVFAVLNHEYLHLVMHKLIGEKIARKFDPLWRDGRFSKVIYETSDSGLPIRKELE